MKGIKNIKNNSTFETLIKGHHLQKNSLTILEPTKNFNISLTSINKCNIKNLIKANYKDKEPPLKKSGV